MCIFSRSVAYVAATKIFASNASNDRQFLAYSMTVDAEEDLSMILPLPVPRDAPQDCVSFIDLSSYPEFFTDLAKGFPELNVTVLTGESSQWRFSISLPVVEVGSFEASFVPTIADFDRLDPRFRLPPDIWSQIPGYDQFGFAVFKLKKGEKRIHPMAFSFPRASSDLLFFPTVHIHDGAVHLVAEFDHSLYCQHASLAVDELQGHWHTSERADSFMDVERACGLIDGSRPVYRMDLKGLRDNGDVYA
jgi:hypothetical protein